MLLTKRYCVSFTVLILLLWKAGSLLAQPSALNRTVSIQASNKTVSECLILLGKETNLRFSYDPQQLLSNRKISVNIKSQPLSEALKTIFNDPELKFREMGSQIVIYKERIKENPPVIPVPVQTPVTQAKPPSSSKISGKDTIFIRTTDTVTLLRTDTVFLSNTTIVHDSILMRDTVFLPAVVNPGVSPENNDSTLFIVPNNKRGWFGTLTFEQSLGKPKYTTDGNLSEELMGKYNEAISASLLNHSVAASIGYDFINWSLSAGIASTRLGEEFDYSYKQLSGGFYKKDTVESYYTVSGIDTAWFYVTDSTYVPVDAKEFSYSNSNSFHYLEFPFVFRYDLLQLRRTECFLTAGLIPGFLIRSRALTFEPVETYPVDWISKQQLAGFMLSVQAGLGTRISFNDKTGLLAEANYRFQLGSQFKDLGINKKINQVNIKTGIFVRF